MSITQATEDCHTCWYWVEDVNDVQWGMTTIIESRVGHCELGWDHKQPCPRSTYRRKPMLRDLEYEHADWLYDRMMDK